VRMLITSQPLKVVGLGLGRFKSGFAVLRHIQAAGELLQKREEEISRPGD